MYIEAQCYVHHEHERVHCKMYNVHGAIEAVPTACKAFHVTTSHQSETASLDKRRQK